MKSDKVRSGFSSLVFWRSLVMVASLLHSQLSRNQFAAVSCRVPSYSMSQDMHYDVPQGSVLGLILFILYTKHIANISNFHGVTLNMYADDCQLYVNFNPDLFKRLNLLFLNYKTVCMIFMYG